jgi:hypothetical protein
MSFARKGDSVRKALAIIVFLAAWSWAIGIAPATAEPTCAFSGGTVIVTLPTDGDVAWILPSGEDAVVVLMNDEPCSFSAPLATTDSIVVTGAAGKQHPGLSS